MFKHNLLIICLLFCLDNFAMARILKLHEAHANYNPDYYQNFSFYVQNNKLNMDMIILKPLTYGFQTTLDFQIRTSKAKVYHSLFTYNMDICRIIDSLKNSIFKKWFSSIRKHGNFLESCPVKEGHYFMYDWECDSSIIPSYMLAGDYRVLARGYFGKYKSKNEVYVYDCQLLATIV